MKQANQRHITNVIPTPGSSSSPSSFLLPLSHNHVIVCHTNSLRPPAADHQSIESHVTDRYQGLSTGQPARRQGIPSQVDIIMGAHPLRSQEPGFTLCKQPGHVSMTNARPPRLGSTGRSARSTTYTSYSSESGVLPPWQPSAQARGQLMVSDIGV